MDYSALSTQAQTRQTVHYVLVSMPANLGRMTEDWRTRTKTAMKEAGITQEALAEHLEVTQGAVQKWLAGTRHPNLEDIDRIAAALRVPGYTLTHGVCAEDTVTDLPEPARTVLRRLIAAQRHGLAPPNLWATLDQVISLALGQATAETQPSTTQGSGESSAYPRAAHAATGRRR
ncbi:helix-turn-helix domain-containing protein [Caldimonas sp.]|uniref:helix-turn-helix domain-containing protein n=1 Tax=Caldimonas sp. TaxID=2838790 RepID=UPI00391CFBC4